MSKVLKELLNVYWLRPETALWRAIDIEIMKDFEEHKAYIYGFFTKESFRNKGYGDMFLKNILEELHNIYGINKIELTVSQENRNAIRLYEKNGFQKNELLKDEYGSGEDRYLMIKVFNL